MISESMVVNKFIDFTRVAAPILYLTTAQAYDDALLMIEHLMETVGENSNKLENLLITLLAQAIERYEASQKDIIEFGDDLLKDNNDVAILRFIIDQHQLNAN